MIARIRKGNDFKHIWPITWNGQPEDFSDATDITLTATVYGQVKTLVEGVDYHIDGGNVVVDFTPAICDITGTYTVELNYIKPSAEFIDGDRRSAVDVQAFQIVNTTAESNATEGVSLPSEALAIYALKYEDLSPENIAELQRPATEAAESIGELEQTIEGNEATRQGNETDRIEAEGIRDANETARIEAESIRDTNETSRIEAEGIRDANETARINAEGDREDAEDLRDQAEVAREEAEGLRQTNTATAIQQAGTATTAANTAAGEANSAATAAITAAGTANDAAATANTAADNANEMSSHPPVIIDDYWHNWNFTTNQYETTGQYARGDSAIEGSLVLQTTGQSAVDVMSQKAVTDEIAQLAGEVSDLNKPIATYKYDLNPEKTITSIDVVTGTFTSASHGLANGNAVSFAKNKTTLDKRNPLYFLPNGVLISTYYVINATTDTFQISTAIGGSALVMTSNATMDLTKVHLEILSAKSVTISGLPVSGNYKANLRLNCTGRASAGVQFRPTAYVNGARWLTSTGLTFSGGMAFADVSGVDNSSNLAVLNTEFLLIGGHKTAIYKGLSSIYSEPSLIESSFVNLMLSDIVPNSTADITSIVLTSTSLTFYVLNGTTIEVYKL